MEVLPTALQHLQHREQMASGRNRIKSTDLALYWITHHAHMISFQTLTYVRQVLMLMSKIPTLNFERGPKCF